MNFTIRGKILIFILLPVLGITALLAFYSYRTLEGSYQNQIASLSMEILGSTAEKVKLFLSKEIDKLQILARNPALGVYAEDATARYVSKSNEERINYFSELGHKWVKDQDRILIDSVLNNIASQLLKDFQIYEKQTYREILLTDRWGGLVAATNKTRDFYQGNEFWWQSTMQANGKVFIGDIEFDDSTETYSITLSFPVMKPGEKSLRGIMKVVLKVNQLFLSSKEFNVGGTGFIRVFNDTGKIVFDFNHQYATRIEEPVVVKKVRGRLGGFFKDSSDGIERFFVFKYVDLDKLLDGKVWTQDKWYFCLGQDIREAFEPLRKTQRDQMIRIAVTTVILLLGTLYLGRRFTQPLSSLVRHTREIAKGNFRVRMEVKSNDEFGELGKAFNQMVERLDRFFRLTESSERRYKALFESAKEGILVVDRETFVVVNANASFASALAKDRGELIGKKLGTLLCEMCPPDSLENTEKILQGEVNTGEATFLTPDGQKKVFEVFSNAFELDGKRFSQCLFRDITDKKQLEEIKNNLIRDVAHELRTPIAKLHISMDLLIHELRERLPENERVQSLSQVMKRSIDRLSTTVESILDFSRLQEGVLHLKPEKFYLGDLLEEVVFDYGDLAKEKGLSLECSVEGRPFLIEADKRLLKMAVGNLLANAIKFTPSGKVVVKALQEGDKVQIWIHDTGIGIAPEHMQQIFDKFFQVSPSIPGCGIGLAISDEIIKLHGGKIWAESRGLGHGATFKVELMNLSSH